MSVAADIVKIKFRTIVVDCPDAQALSDFYAKLLGWKKTGERDGR